MSPDKISDLARIFATIVKEHGVEVALMALPLDVQKMIYHYFYNGIQAENKIASKS